MIVSSYQCPSLKLHLVAPISKQGQLPCSFSALDQLQKTFPNQDHPKKVAVGRPGIFSVYQWHPDAHKAEGVWSYSYSVYDGFECKND